KKWENNPYGGRSEFEFHEIVSAGLDGKFGTDDDIKLSDPINWNGAGWWLEGGERFGIELGLGRGGAMRGLGGEQRLMERAAARDAAMPLAAPAGAAGAGGFGNAPGPAGPPRAMNAVMDIKKNGAAEGKSGGGGG